MTVWQKRRKSFSKTRRAQVRLICCINTAVRREAPGPKYLPGSAVVILKNFSYQCTNGAWKLSPAYDLLPGSGFNGCHTVTLNGKREPTLTDIMALAVEIALSRQLATQVIEELTDKCTAEKMEKVRLK